MNLLPIKGGDREGLGFFFSWDSLHYMTIILQTVGVAIALARASRSCVDPSMALDTFCNEGPPPLDVAWGVCCCCCWSSWMRWLVRYSNRAGFNSPLCFNWWVFICAMACGDERITSECRDFSVAPVDMTGSLPDYSTWLYIKKLAYILPSFWLDVLVLLSRKVGMISFWPVKLSSRELGFSSGRY